MKTVRPIWRAAAWISSVSSAVVELFGLTSTPIGLSFAASSSRNCRHFESKAVADMATPVTLPLGRLRLVLTPFFRTLSLPRKTIGTVDVVAAAASTTSGPPVEAITETRRLTKSAASAGSRS
jgi:hypothetical protein